MADNSSSVSIPMTEIGKVIDNVLAGSQTIKGLKNMEDSYIGANLLVGANQYTSNNPWSITSALTKWHDTGAYVSVEKERTYTLYMKGITTNGSNNTIGLFENATTLQGENFQITSLPVNGFHFTPTKNTTLHVMVATISNEIETQSGYDFKIELGTEKTPYCQNLEEKVDNSAYAGTNIVVGANQYTQATPLSYSDANNTWHSTGIYIDLVKGEQYTLSVGGMTEINSTGNNYISLCEQGTAIDIQHAGIIYSPTHSAAMNGYTFTARATERLYFWFATRQNVGDGSYTVYNIKVEPGTKKTRYVQNIESKVDAQEYVGANLLVGANQYNKTNPLIMSSTLNTYHNIGDIHADLVQGQIYTLSAEGFQDIIGKDTENPYVGLFTNLTGDTSGKMVYGAKVKEALEGYTFTATKTERLYIKLCTRVAPNTLYYTCYNMKVELGINKTQYCPNIEEKVDKAEYIGTNLLVGGNGYVGEKYFDKNNASSASWVNAGIYANLVKGKTYTINAKLKSGTEGAMLICNSKMQEAPNAPTLTQLFRFFSNNDTFNDASDAVKASSSFPITFTAATTETYTIYTLGTLTKNGTTFNWQNNFKDIKLELGTMATDYVPNLEEMENGITSSLKIFTDYYQNVDLNTLMKTGVYKVSGNLANLPSDVTGNNGWGNMIVMNTGSYVSQFYHVFLTNSLYIRRSIDGGGSWNTWSKL